MKRYFRPAVTWLCGVCACALSWSAQAVLITNGGFEGGFTGWTHTDQAGSEGTFFLQSGTASPVNGDPVPPPPQGVRAAMTDAAGPGSHVLYQDFLVTAPITPTSVNFSLFVGNRAPEFDSPPTLDFSTPVLNQQARVDILASSSDPFSVTAADVLLNLFQTNPGDPFVSGYAAHSVDVTSLLNAHVGQTLRLRFAEVDNVFTFQLGVDNVSFSSPAATGVAEPSSWLLAMGALVSVMSVRRRIRPVTRL
jgi:hypothetical protein